MSSIMRFSARQVWTLAELPIGFVLHLAKVSPFIISLQKGLVDRAIDGPEDITKFDAATWGRLPTIGHDTCDFCGANFGAGNVRCSICGIGSLQRSDAASGTVASPFG
jgi:hypothetical protein